MPLTFVDYKDSHDHAKLIKYFSLIRLQCTTNMNVICVKSSFLFAVTALYLTNVISCLFRLSWQS